MKSELRFWLVPVLVLIGAYGCGGDVTPDDVTGDDTLLEDVPGDTVVEDLVAEDVLRDTTGDVVEADVVPEFNTVLAGSLQKLLDEHVAFSPDPGLTLSVRNADGSWWNGAAGVSNILEETPMQADTAFRVGSNTKPIVAAVVLQLVEEGKVSLDEPLTTYLPEYSEWSDITVRHLLNMRSGLKDFLGVTACLLEILFAPDVAVTPDHIVQFVMDDTDNGRVFPVNTDGKYSNTNYVLLGMIIEKVTGNTADYEIDERILKPLHMDNTYLDLGATDNEMLAQGYIDFSLAGTALGVKPGQAAMIPNATYENGLLIGTNLMHPTVTWTSGALVSTSEDMTKFVYALASAQLFSQETFDLMATTQGAQLFSGIVQYGLGLQVRPTNQGDSVGHGGMNFGYQAATYFFPDNGITISHLHNFLLDSYDTFQDDLMKMILAGGDAEFEPCLAPEGLYRDGTGGRFFNMAFKGVVNHAITKPPLYGTGSFRMVDETGIRPVSGIFPSATAGTANGKANVTITGYGLPAEGDANLVITSVIFAETVFDGLSEEGRKNVELANAADAFVMMAEAYYADDGVTVIKLCYTGVSDVMRTGEVFLCKDSRELPGVGEDMRVMASLPFSHDEAYIDQVLTNLGMIRCNCLNGSTWGACAE